MSVCSYFEHFACFGLQGSFQAQAVSTAYQPMPQAVVQGRSPVMMAPMSMNQMETARAPVMLMPVQTMQQMPGTSGNSNGLLLPGTSGNSNELMYVQVPYGSTQENTSSQVPQGTIQPSGPQSSEDTQVRFILIEVCLQLLPSLLKN